MSENYENITTQQLELLNILRERVPDVKIRWDNTRGVASRARGSLYRSVDEKGEPRETLISFMEKYSPLFGPRGKFQEYSRYQRTIDDSLEFTHLFYQQVYMHRDEKEIEVYGAKLAAHFNEAKRLIEIQSSCWRDVKVDKKIDVRQEEARRKLLKVIEPLEGFREIREQQEKNEYFPLTERPRLVVKPWKKGYNLAWVGYGYGPIHDMPDTPLRAEVTYGKIILDANTGEVLLFSPTLQSAENPDTGSGSAVTPITPPHTTRSLNIVRVGTSNTYRLKDTTLNRDIITYDPACDTDYNSDSEIAGAIDDGTLPFSEDTDVDKTWDRLPSDTTAAQRNQGQQPEVDAHYYARRQYLWYDALAGGRDGWDDGNYSSPPVPPQTINVLAHCYPPPAWFGNCSMVNAYKWSRKVDGNWVYWLAFMNGTGTTFDYPAGSHFIFAHEYQHAITDFCMEDGDGDPGLTYAGWLGAVHEGLSDVFGGLSTEQWTPCTDISHHTPQRIFRNLAYPRDPDAHDSDKLDHFADRDTDAGFYSRGTILAHCAYLMGNGGVHERASRTPELIPVYGLGKQTVNGLSVLRAARIWYRAITVYFSTHGNLVDEPDSDSDTFRALREACVSSAIDIYGEGSKEHLTTVLAFYAVGLHPAEEDYGPDPTFLKWGSSWRLSRPYIGLNSPDWSSLDLFVNNGGASEWNALINIEDSTGNPTQYENTVYCRVRNVGDQDAHNVQVNLYYTKIGTGVTNWLPVTDKDGNVQTLNIGTLQAGESTFPDSDQDTPPAASGVKWYIPPLLPGESVHHFCLKAEVTSSDDVNQYNNEAQSNIAYTAYTPATGATMLFYANNATKKMIPVEIEIDKELPRDWHVFLKFEDEQMWLEPFEEKQLELEIKMPRGADRKLAPPFNGTIIGECYGELSGPLRGTLTKTYMTRNKLVGTISARLGKLGKIMGRFQGSLNILTGEIDGRVKGRFSIVEGRERSDIRIGIRGCLYPWRRVNISQIVDDEPIGGFTIQLQMPPITKCCDKENPPTDTHVPKRAILKPERIEDRYIKYLRRTPEK